MAVVDTRGLTRTLRRAGGAVVKAQRKAKRDAAKQTRTAMTRDTIQKLNLLAKRVRDRIRVIKKRSGDRQEVRTSYGRVPAHHFKGWTYTRGIAGRVVRETAKVSWLGGSKDSAFALKVVFERGRPALTFPKAFRQPSIGHGRLFLQRKRSARYPVEPITGPSPHSVVYEHLPKYRKVGREAYVRRLRYWRDVELKRAV